MTDTFTSSPFVTAIEPITETDDEIRAFLADAEIPPLLPAIAYATGDVSLLRPELAPDPIMAAMPQGGLSVEQSARALRVSVDTVMRDWKMAKAWLLRELKQPETGRETR